MPDQPLVLLIEPADARYHHADALASAGFRSQRVAAADMDIARLQSLRPAVIAAERDGGIPLELVKRLRQDPRTRLIPFIIYGHHLRPEDIENAARSGALWLQLEPNDGARLVAAVRGLIAASRHEDDERTRSV